MENKSQFLTVETICIKYSIKLENIIELWCDNNILSIYILKEIVSIIMFYS
jgi:hypothetical protein